MRLSWGQKLSVLASRVEGICESLDNTTLSWFKLLTSNSDIGEYFEKIRGFSQPPAVFETLYCVFAQPVPS